jgi:hypothetical protein
MGEHFYTWENAFLTHGRMFELFSQDLEFPSSSFPPGNDFAYIVLVHIPKSMVFMSMAGKPTPFTSLD